jgi:cephalosporin hydroxylase
MTNAGEARMKNRLWLLRTILVSAIVGTLVYIHGSWGTVVIERFAKLSYSDPNTWSRNQWLGIPTWQNPNDAWIIQEIITEVKPDYLVEAGTFYGGSAVLWATILREVKPSGRVITIDIEDHAARAKTMDISQKMITFISGSSTDPKIVSEITRQVKGKKTLVILDSDHRKDHVLKEMENYAPLVNVGSYLIVQDSNVNGHPVYASFGPGPMEAIESFLASNDNFQPDADRERLLYTTNPRGYLKRIKAN